ncbi:MAG: hypothetical protein MN733_24555 [Nitrososphaera sp.]|nr:hypothetical protein [Nitrososphaera sp.]
MAERAYCGIVELRIPDMKKASIFSTLLLGIKYGVFAILATSIFLPLPIIIGDYFGRINTVGHYSGPLPALWICGLSIAIAIPFALPFVIGGCILSSIIVIYDGTGFLKKGRERVSGVVLGMLSTSSGLFMFNQPQLEALGNWVFIGIMMVWGMVLFGWIGHRMQQSLIQPAEHFPPHNIKDEPN